MAYEAVKVKKPLTLILLPIISVLTFFLVWELIVQFEVVPKTMLAHPGRRPFHRQASDPNPMAVRWPSRLLVPRKPSGIC
jgi:hypothetical protein